MDRRDVSKVLLGVAVGSTLLSRQAEAGSCPAGGPAYLQTPAELAAGVTPTCSTFPPGNILRYGADPTGGQSSVSALIQAIQCSNVVYAPAGTYSFDAEITLPLSKPGYTILNGLTGLTIVGDGRGATRFQLSANSPSTAAILHWTARAGALRIERIHFLATNQASSQYCLRFGALRDALIDDCTFDGWADTTMNLHSGSLAISIEVPADDYTGDLDIRDCNFGGQYIAIALSGPNTTVRITNCTFSGNQQNTNVIGVDGGAKCGGVVVQGCSFYGWGIGVYYQGAYLRQANNYFEANTADWFWANGGASGNSINNCSICDINPGQANTVHWSYPAGQGCYVVGPTYQ